MGKKYIVKLDDNKLAYTAIIIDGVPYIKPLQLLPYTEPDLEQVKRDYDAWYEKGLADAWEAARKIGSNSMCSLKEMGFDFSQCAVPDYNPSWFVVKNYSASEAIEKIRQYEQEKEEIQVGDEVELKCGVRPAIYMQGTKESDEIYLLFNDGSCGLHSKSEIERKTGRHFPEFATVLQKMKES